MKACKIVSIVSIALLLSQFAWAQNRSDADIRAELAKKIQPSTGVSVAVKDGVVTLSGTVPTVFQKNTIIGFARKAVGVRQVIDKITVVPVQKHTDEAITATIQRALKGNLSPEELSAIKIEVRNGVVTLTGTLSSSYPKQVAGILAGWLPGVVGVQNAIVVKPSQLRTDLNIAADVRRRFQDNPFVSSQKININVVNGVVTLQGVVDNYMTADQAESDARFTPGVVDVNNLLFVRQSGT